MLFNSVEFILFFLPFTLIVYYALTHHNQFRASKMWLMATSLFFYGWWNPKYLLLILASMVANYCFSRFIGQAQAPNLRKVLLVLGIVFNLGLLAYYKYADFFIENFNFVFDTNYTLLHIILPLGISFFTFQQIALLVDSYKRIVTEFDFINYGVFVCFFPQLIAGPIVHHKEIMPQLLDDARSRFDANNFAKGIFVFNMGLAKKIIIADSFAKIANLGYGNYELLDFSQAWATAFAYTMQIYFDFSGYSDMAIGLGMLFNILIPINFFSPYKSESIQQFWRRWHMTLSRFMRDYIYIPLGGNKYGEMRTNINLFLVFLIGGLWHGASWTFVAWGALNGAALVVHRQFQRANLSMPHLPAVLLTFLFAMLCWVFFRAEEFPVAMGMLEAMSGLSAAPGNFLLISNYYDLPIWIAGVILLFMPNSNQIAEGFVTNYRFASLLILLLFINFTFMNSAVKQDFLYFDF